MPPKRSTDEAYSLIIETDLLGATETPGNQRQPFKPDMQTKPVSTNLVAIQGASAHPSLLL